MFYECDRGLSGRTKFDIIYIVHELQTRRLMVTVKATASGLAVIYGSYRSSLRGIGYRAALSCLATLFLRAQLRR